MGENKEKIYKHKNGFTAKLYGESSLIIINKYGRVVMHTASRNVNTEQEVMDLLESLPNFWS